MENKWEIFFIILENSMMTSFLTCKSEKIKKKMIKNKKKKK
jgi:hypothetical protein